MIFRRRPARWMDLRLAELQPDPEREALARVERRPSVREIARVARARGALGLLELEEQYRRAQS